MLFKDSGPTKARTKWEQELGMELCPERHTYGNFILKYVPFTKLQ